MRLLVCLLASLFISCSTSDKIVSTDLTNSQITLEIVPGKSYTNQGKFLLFTFEKGPQMASWIEDINGIYNGTIFATDKTSKQSWIDSPPQGRPESLPVWSNRKSRAIDTISSATSNSHAPKNYNSTSILPPGEYTVYFEVNISYDWNERWKKDLSKENTYYNGVNGQPSILYKTNIKIGSGADSVKLKPFGVGSALGLTGEILENLEGVDSALNIIDSIIVKVNN